MTGIELLRKYVEEGTCDQIPDTLGKKCDDFESCNDCRRFVFNAIADQIEREIKEALTDGADDENDAFEDMSGARTGIEMLRSYVYHARVHVRNLYINHVADINAVPLYESLRECLRQLDEIADRIERETLPRPRFEDGEPVQVGDKYVDKYGNVATAFTVAVSNHGFTLCGSGSETHFKLTDSVKRPDPPDSWERVEEDALKSTCEYYGHSEQPCETCPANKLGLSCGQHKTRDLVRRCKELAGVE